MSVQCECSECYLHCLVSTLDSDHLPTADVLKIDGYITSVINSIIVFCCSLVVILLTIRNVYLQVE